jgi:hypothetical protein
VSDLFDDLDEQVEAEAQDDTEAYIAEAIALVSQAKAMPLSSSVLVQRDELIELLEIALQRLPAELAEARRMLLDREDFLAESQRAADGIMEEARIHAERMVQRTEVVRQANHVSQRILDDANEEARRRRHEVDDYVGRQLARFEIVLDRTLKTVQAGREKLKPAPMPNVEIGDQGDTTVSAPGSMAGDEADAFFDQDLD